MKLSSTAFKLGATIPRKYTCDGDNLSPPLAWEGAPPEAKSFALIMDDPDAPSGTFVHWVLYDIPPAFSELREGVKGFGALGSNSYRKVSYNGPCPPQGPAHRYFFKVYALDQLLKLHPGATRADVERAMQGHILEQAQLMGKYGR
jgi:Raf kinase inhibitor-like YbhB/YbcL family protein